MENEFKFKPTQAITFGFYAAVGAIAVIIPALLAYLAIITLVIQR